MLSDLIKPRVCELGKIKIGGLGEERTKASGNGTYRLPEKHDYFTVTTMHRDAKRGLVPDEELMASLKDLADPDGRLRQLPISLLSNEPEDILQAAYVWYNGTRMAAKSDGRTLTRYFDTNKGWLPQPEELPWKPEFAERTDAAGNRLFKLHATLNCVVAAPAARWGGVYKFRTTSGISAEQLYGSLTQLRLLTGGQLRGLPLRLVVRPVQVSPGGKTTTVYVVHIELRGPDLQTLQELALQRARFEIDNAKQLGELQQQYRALLAAPGDRETEEEQAEVAAEFHPEPAAAADAAVVTTATAAPAGESVTVAPAGGQHSTPMPTPEQFEENFIDGLGVIHTEAGLDRLVGDVREAFGKGYIKAPHRDRIAAKVKARRAEIKATPATTTTTAPTEAAAEAAAVESKS